MQIRFVSALTSEEEDQLAPALLKAVTSLLDQFPLAYTLRIETAGNQVHQHSRPAQAYEAATHAGVRPRKPPA